MVGNFSDRVWADFGDPYQRPSAAVVAGAIGARKHQLLPQQAQLIIRHLAIDPRSARRTSRPTSGASARSIRANGDACRINGPANRSDATRIAPATTDILLGCSAVSCHQGYRASCDPLNRPPTAPVRSHCGQHRPLCNCGCRRAGDCSDRRSEQVHRLWVRLDQCRAMPGGRAIAYDRVARGYSIS